MSLGGKMSELKPCKNCGAPTRSVWDVVSYPVDIHWMQCGKETVLATHATAQEAIADLPNHGTESEYVAGRFTLSDYVLVGYRHRHTHTRASGWQDISTAPKDGTPFIGYRESCGDVGEMMWDNSGFTDVIEQHADLNDATHWMPLPEPPET